MAIPTDRNSFKSYCLRKLGDPVIRINVSDDQIDDRIEEGLYKFYERNFYAVETVYIYYDLQQADIDQGYIVLPPDIVGVTDVFRPTMNYGRSIGVSSVEYQSFITDVYSTGTMFRFGEIAYYFMINMNLTLLNSFFAPARQFDFNPISNKLIIAGGLQATANAEGAVVVRGFRKLLGETNDDGTMPVDNQVVHNIWRVKWLQDYVTALIKRQWASNLRKYQNVQLLGGVTMNGAELASEAKDEIKELEDQLLNEYELPPGFIMG